MHKLTIKEMFDDVFGPAKVEPKTERDPIKFDIESMDDLEAFLKEKLDVNEEG